MAKKVKQEDLPGIADRRIEDLHAKALEYVSVRDERMEMSKKESPLKDELLSLMKKHKRDKYICEGVEIYREFSEETIKVKVHKSGEDNANAESVPA